MSIVAQKITYIHPDNQVLFKGIDLTINKGQKVALVGNNGSGKSTFLRILAGTLQAQEGEIIYPTPPYYVPQHFGQYDNLTVAQALRIDGKLEALRAITEGDASLSNFNTLADDWTIEERSLAALHAWGLEHILLSQPMRTLSGGEKTKVFLSGIEIHQPSILLLDEPTNHLDKRSREKLYDFITSCRITLLVVSHDRTLLNLLASIAELSVGGITLYGGNYDFYKEQKEQVLNETKRLFEEIIEEKNCLSIKELKINGKDLMDMGVPQGKEIGEILSWLLDQVLEQPVLNERETLTAMVKEKRDEQ